ncbi:hypothetical protein LX36DRAFT_54594 [Colletotrichum falcatum]|nr:hypothetical protein LX36DRAFT_54594 [Colletotrichum falcatum]
MRALRRRWSIVAAKLIGEGGGGLPGTFCTQPGLAGSAVKVHRSCPNQFSRCSSLSHLGGEGGDVSGGVWLVHGTKLANVRDAPPHDQGYYFPAGLGLPRGLFLTADRGHRSTMSG